MEVRQAVLKHFREILAENGVQMKAEPDDATVLLETDLDSLGFAMLVTRLEVALGYDPFLLMEDAVYPRTFGEFVSIYEAHKDHAQSE